MAGVDACSGCWTVGFPLTLLLGSVVALGVAVAVTLVLMVRIMREERLLATELGGYEEYRRKVRYRLWPRLW